MPSLVEILCILEEEIGLVCRQLPHDMHAMETSDIQPTCELSLLSIKLSEPVGYFTACEKLRALKKKSKPLKQVFDALETNSLSLMTMLKFF